MTRVALDSDILAYLSGVERVEADKKKIVRIKAMVDSLAAVTLVAPVQTLGELFVVLRKGGFSASDSREIVVRIAGSFDTPSSERKTALAAADLVVDHKLQFWDAMIISAAADAGCTILLSEDMQHGSVTRGMTVVNPFAEPMHARLAGVLA